MWIRQWKRQTLETGRPGRRQHSGMNSVKNREDNQGSKHSASERTDQNTVQQTTVRYSGTDNRRGKGTDKAMHSGKQRGTYSGTGNRTG